MADVDRLTALGLGVTDSGAGPEALLQLETPLLNPLARRPIASAVFALAEELLIPLEPAELVGLPAIALDGIRSRSVLEQQLASLFRTHLETLQRRSAQLRALGIAPRIDPETLELSARFEDAPFRYVLSGDKSGQLRITEAVREGDPVVPDLSGPFELAEFPNRPGLLAHLRTLFGPEATPGPLPIPAAAAPASSPTPATAVSPVGYQELIARFGSAAWVPASAAIDVVVMLRVRGIPYRFAATRIGDRMFRALLAGPSGKVWADQFQLDAFAGVASVVSQALDVAIEDVELLAPSEAG